jgi:hypothetical protein
MMTNVGVLEASINNGKEKKVKLDESRKIKVAYREELPHEVKEAVGDRKILGFVTGAGLQNLTQTIVMTESEVIFFDSLLFGHKKNEVPYSQIVCAAFQLQNRAPEFLIYTRYGMSKFILSGSGKKRNKAALNLFRILKNKLGELAGVRISEEHSTWLMKETWFFYTPPQYTLVGA